MNAKRSNSPRHAAILPVLLLLFPSFVQAQSYTRDFPVKWSYFQHTTGDRDALDANNATRWGVDDYGTPNQSYPAGAIEADSSMYTRLLGADKVISSLNAGDYLHIRVTGKAKLVGQTSTDFESAGVFVDRSKIRKRHGYRDRFENIANLVGVESLQVGESRPNGLFKGQDGNWSGLSPVEQDTPKDFSLGMSNGSGVIVKVPSSGNCFFHTINHSKFSTITRDGAQLTFTKVDPATGRPKFFLQSGLSYTEGSSFSIPLIRTFRNEFPTRCKVTVSYGTAGAADVQAGLNGMTRDVDFPANHNPFADGAHNVFWLDGFSIPDDEIYEGNETFYVTVTVEATNNPNEAYVENNGVFSYTYPITVVNRTPVPNVYFYSGNTDTAGNGYSTTLCNEGQPTSVEVKLDRPSTVPLDVWYSDHEDPNNPGELNAAGGGVGATTGQDYSYSSASPLRFTVNPTTGQVPQSLPISLNILDEPQNSPSLYESNEKIVLHLGVVPGQAGYNRSWKPASNKGNGNVGMSGRHVFIVQDNDPLPKVSFSLVDPLHPDDPSKQGSSTVSEPDNGTGGQVRQVRVNLTGLSATTTNVPLQYTGTAALGNNGDFTGPDLVEIPANTSFATFDITVLDDSLTEFDEIILIEIGSPYQGLQPGSPPSIGLTIVDNDGGDHSNQLLPGGNSPRPDGSGGLAMVTDNTMPVAVWRIRGEPLWRFADDPATSTVEGLASGLVPGFHEIEFRSFDGYVTPPPMVVEVAAGQIWTPQPGSRPYYAALETNPPGTSLTVTLTGSSGGGWKLDGETAWRSSGSTFTGFPKGIYRVFFKPVTGFFLPKESVLSFSSTVVRNISKIYVSDDTNSALLSWPPPGGIGNALINDNPAESTLFVGRISSSAGYGTGTAAHVNTVLTCGHILFDDSTLSFATNVRWHHQAQKDFHQPAAELASEYSGVVNERGKLVNVSGMVPRGWLVMGDYAAKRIEHMESGGAPGFATPESQNLDVGALFFNKPVARGAKVGLAIRKDDETPGRWLQAAQDNLSAPVSKRLLGYPYDNVPHDDIGKVFRRTYSHDPMNLQNSNYQIFTLSRSHDYVFNSHNIVAGSGMSGAPVMLETSTGVWKQCAIYLGSNLGSNYGVMRELGEDAGSLVTVAQGLSDPNNDTTGGNSSLGSSLTSVNLNKGRAYFKANVAGASWQVSGTQSSKSCGFGGTRGEPLDLTPNVYTPVVFGAVPNWKAPAMMPVIAAAGTETEHQISYLPLNYSAISSLLTSNGATAASSGPLGDFDSDGISNLLEWAFNLSPGTRDAHTLFPATGTSGLPYVSLAGSGISRRIKIEFVRLRSSVVPGIQYIPEFTTGLDGSSWTAGGNVISTSIIDSNWERVVVEDAQTGGSRRFARVRVVSN